MEGILEKPSRIPGRKTKVWSVLGESTLSFFQENKRSSCIASVELADINKVSQISDCQFEIVTNINTQTYTAPSAEQCREWIKNLSKFSRGQVEIKKRVRESLAVLGTLTNGDDHTVEVKSARALFEKDHRLLNNFSRNKSKSKDFITTNQNVTENIIRSTLLSDITEKDTVINSQSSVVNTNTVSSNSKNEDRFKITPSNDISDTGTSSLSTISKRAVSDTVHESSRQELSLLRNSDPSCSNVDPTLNNVLSQLHHVNQKNTKSAMNTNQVGHKPEIAIVRNQLKHVTSKSAERADKPLGNMSNATEIINSIESIKSQKDSIFEKGKDFDLTNTNKTHCETIEDSVDGQIFNKNEANTDDQIENKRITTVENSENLNTHGRICDGKGQENEEAVVIMRKSKRSVSVSRSDVVTKLPIDESNSGYSNDVFTFPNTRRNKNLTLKTDNNCKNSDQPNPEEKEQQPPNNLKKHETANSEFSTASIHDDVDGVGNITISSKENKIENYPDIDTLLNNINFTGAPPLPNDIPNRTDLKSFHELKSTLEDLTFDHDEPSDDSYHGEDVIHKLSLLVES